jgi:YbgC/YbaW family acyl-CoA thioester hydrolase
MEFEAIDYALTIKENHLDTFGHVNNATYLQLFEEARWEVITPRGFGMKEIMKSGLGPTLLEVKLQWKKELRNRERITIRTQVTSAQGKIQMLRQTMLNEKGEEACVADFVVGLFDVKARKLIDPTPEWKKALGLPQ